MGLLGGSDRELVAPVAATREQMQKLHAGDYLDAMKLASDGHFDPSMLHYGLGTPDCPVFEGMYEYAKLAVGATLTGVDQILAGNASVAFNPSGGYHHAMITRAAGFCYINDSALACLNFADAGKKTLYLDIDVHHGDGVQYACYDRNDIMTISTHQCGRTIFPGTGSVDEIGVGDGAGYSVNMSLPLGTYDGAFLRVFNETVLPLAKAYEPDVIVVELGADTLAGDPLAQMRLTNNIFVEVISQLLKFDRPILAVGGGGYNIENTVRAWTLCWSALCGETFEHENLGMGGVMMSSTDWPGGLIDPHLPPAHDLKDAVDSEIDQVISDVKEKLFPFHGL
jgi:acetoin utilization protein AcuC